MKIPLVVSYDPKKVFLVKESVVKLTNIQEVINISRFRELIKNQKIILSDFGPFQIKVATIEDFDHSRIEMEFLSGDNLEILLRSTNKEKREKLINITASLFNWFYVNSIVWHDFAPRNIMLNFDRKIVGFVDFERGLTVVNGKLDLAEYYFYLSSIIIEEWGAFLTVDELNYLVPNFWEIVKDVDDKKVDALTSKRKLAVFRMLYSNQPITTKKIVAISRFMQELVQARDNNGLLVFPLIVIEKMTKKLGVNYYAQLVIKQIKKGVI